MPETQLRHLRPGGVAEIALRSLRSRDGTFVLKSRRLFHPSPAALLLTLHMEEPHFGKQRASTNFPLRNRRQLLYKQTYFGMCNPASPLGFRKSLNLSDLFEDFESCLNLLQPLLALAGGTLHELPPSLGGPGLPCIPVQLSRAFPSALEARR